MCRRTTKMLVKILQARICVNCMKIQKKEFIQLKTAYFIKTFLGFKLRERTLRAEDLLVIYCSYKPH
jgi:hypothetical protein